ncbi:MAG TPA: hypothetical protein PK095_00430 [Myxococcota bacterium]|nr:hypothetical protein [Myxococcota bacterium]
MRAAVLGFGAIIALLAFPREEVGLEALIATLGWATFVSVFIGWMLARNALPTATVLAAIALAYTQGLGDASVAGLPYGGFHTSAASVVLAVLGVSLFLLVSGLVSRAVVGIVHLRWSPGPPAAGDRSVFVGAIVFLGATLLAAIATGAWSYWGDRSVAPDSETGLIRLELFYSPTLIICAWFAVLARRDVVVTEGPTRTGWRVWLFAAAIALMLFALQSRRLMVGAGLMLAFALVVTTPASRLRSMLWRALGLAAVLFAFSTASAGWRELSTESRISLADRFEGALEAVGDTRAFEQIESRLTYLWFDALSHELTHAGIELSMSDLAVSNLARAVPRVLLPTKDDIEAVACETFLDGLALPEDLPCTPSGEGILWAGFWGILFVGLIVGLNLGVAELLVERGGLRRIIGLFLLVPFAMLETGAFGFIAGLRLAVIGTGFIALFALVARLILGRGMGRGPGRRRAT